ncbi:MAG TPA: hypothetical protein VFV87_08750 [Pirellulaceae bacterium]|nr:hypothetical protein [Pirellulaceae bacterium]
MRCGGLFWRFIPVAVWAISGCGARVRPPAFSPSAASAAAIKQLDTSGSDQLEAEELRQAPGLAAALDRADADKSGTLSQGEIRDRIASYGASRVGLMPFTCTVRLDGRELAGAEVKLVPEAFLASALKPAIATTSETGVAAPVVEGEQFAAMPCGMYRVEISQRDAAGAQIVPARYNVRTELGQEIAPDVPGLERGVVFELVTQ